MEETGQTGMRITVDCLAYGQARPYADNVYRYRVFLETRDGATWSPSPWVKEPTIPYLKAIRPWVESGSADDSWAQPHLEHLKQLGPGLWEFQVRELYCD